MPDIAMMLTTTDCADVENVSELLPNRQTDMTSSVFLATSSVNPLDEPLMPLWLPYVLLTAVMLLLLAASFARFHIQRGYQYDDRAPAAPTTSTTLSSSVDYATSLSSSSYDNNKLNCQFVAPRYQTSSRIPLASAGMSSVSSTPEIISSAVGAAAPADCFGTFVSFQQPLSETSKRSVEPLNDFSSVAAAVMAAKRQRNSSRSRSPAGMSALTRITCLGSRQFAFNANGSMVDVRCLDEERMNTFRLGSVASRDNSSSTLIVMTTSCENEENRSNDDDFAPAEFMVGDDDDGEYDDVKATIAAAAISGNSAGRLQRRPNSMHDRLRNRCDGSTRSGGGAGGRATITAAGEIVRKSSLDPRLLGNRTDQQRFASTGAKPMAYEAGGSSVAVDLKGKSDAFLLQLT